MITIIYSITISPARIIVASFLATCKLNSSRFATVIQDSLPVTMRAFLYFRHQVNCSRNTQSQHKKKHRHQGKVPPYEKILHLHLLIYNYTRFFSINVLDSSEGRALLMVFQHAMEISITYHYLNSFFVHTLPFPTLRFWRQPAEDMLFTSRCTRPLYHIHVDCCQPLHMVLQG